MEVTPSLVVQQEKIRGKMGLIRAAVAEQLSQVIMPHVVERARLNAPILEGDLRSSIQFRSPTVSGGVVVTGIGSDLPYALRWHEEDFNLGPISILQPATLEGGIGKKYITRVVNYWNERYKNSLREAVARSLVAGEVVTVPVD
jgi:hypothetical protein